MKKTMFVAVALLASSAFAKAPVKTTIFECAYGENETVVKFEAKGGEVRLVSLDASEYTYLDTENEDLSGGPHLAEIQNKKATTIDLAFEDLNNDGNWLYSYWLTVPSNYMDLDSFSSSIYHEYSDEYSNSNDYELLGACTKQ